MVARTSNTDSPPKHPIAVAFRWWRRLLGGLGARARHALSGVVREVRDVRSGGVERLERPAVLWLGCICLITGVALRALVESSVANALLAGLSTALLAGARLAIMALSDAELRADAPKLRGAWAIGLTPLAIAADPGSTLIAWLASAGLTWAALTKQGRARRTASRAVALAWGVTALLSAAEWFARGALTALAPGA